MARSLRSIFPLTCLALLVWLPQASRNPNNSVDAFPAEVAEVTHRQINGNAGEASPLADFSTQIKQITFGPKHHFFGYIGHVQTIPWNRSGRYVLALETEFQERMPAPGDAADILLLDTRNNYAPKVVDRTRAWNFQQGTMLYWNPALPETQFFFNDRDPQTQEEFCVLFDISRGQNGERIAEYGFPTPPIRNR